jgi:hypothetical protein
MQLRVRTEPTGRPAQGSHVLVVHAMQAALTFAGMLGRSNVLSSGCAVLCAMRNTLRCCCLILAMQAAPGRLLTAHLCWHPLR